MWKWVLATVLVATFSVGLSLAGEGFAIGVVGFWPALIAIILSWGYLLITAMYFLEATLATPLGTNVFNISRTYFGPLSAWIVSIIWLIVLLGTFISVLYLMPFLIASMLAHHGVILSPHWIGGSLCLLTGIIFCLGLRFTMIVNGVLGLLLGFILYKSYRLGFAEFNPEFFKVNKVQFLILVFPFIITSVYYHILIPTLASFFNHNKQQIRTCLIVGSLFGISIFAIWCIVISSSFRQFGVENLGKRLDFLNYEQLSLVPIIGKWMPSLSLISMLTTFLGIGIAFVDFFEDLFGYPFEERKGIKRVGVVALTLISTYLLSLIPLQYTFSPVLYLTDFAGLFVTGLLPILWVWSLRSSWKSPQPATPGGNTFLALMTLLSCFVFYLLGVQIIYQISS